MRIIIAILSLLAFLAVWAFINALFGIDDRTGGYVAGLATGLAIWWATRPANPVKEGE